MGGVAGHMNHLYDNPNLTFSKMKEVIIAASEGRLEGTEKTDGQNLFITYDIESQSARAARNKGNLRSGGLDATGLAAKFAGRGSVEAAFNEAFSIFEKAVSSLPIEEQRALFQPEGPESQVYYNAEIQDPRNANVINYDTKTLNIHRVGHVKYNGMTGEIGSADLSKEASYIEGVLNKMQASVKDDNFRIQMNAIRNLQSLSNKEPARKALDLLEKTINAAGISDQDTVEDFLVARILPVIKKSIDLPPEHETMLLKKILGYKGVKINDIKRNLPPQQKQIITSLAKNAANIAKRAIEPVENIVHDFSVEVLRHFESMFVLDNTKEVERLKAEVDRAIRSIEASGSEEAMVILQQQMRKLKVLDNVTTASEGFVFDYDGVTYKFTGNFAPINQILGLFKYGRKGISIEPVDEENMDEMLQSLNENILQKKVAIKFGNMSHYHTLEKWLGMTNNPINEDNDFVEVRLSNNEVVPAFSHILSEGLIENNISLDNLLAKDFTEEEGKAAIEGAIRYYANVLFEQEMQAQYVVMIPGGFKPPTAGHYNMINQYAQHPSVKEVIVIQGPKARLDSAGKEYTNVESKAVFELYGGFPNNVSYMYSREGEKTPMHTAYNLVTEENFTSQFNLDTMIFSLGASSKGGDDKRVREFANYFNEREGILPQNVRVLGPPFVAPVFERDGIQLSASTMRKALADGDLQMVKLHLPGDEYLNAVLQILDYDPEQKKTMEETINLTDLFSLVESVMDEKKKKKVKRKKQNKNYSIVADKDGQAVIDVTDQDTKTRKVDEDLAEQTEPGIPIEQASQGMEAAYEQGGIPAIMEFLQGSPNFGPGVAGVRELMSTVPDKVQDIIQRMIDRSETDQALGELGKLVGQEFAPRAGVALEEYDEDLDEASSMGGGSVEGAVGNMTKKRFNSLIREEDDIIERIIHKLSTGEF
jgi:hypothetical protein